MKSQSFKIYNASAGSGKTFTLVKQYLITLLKSDKKGSFKKLLALTFTNKAVGEMKDRVINTLKGIAFPERFDCDQAMANQICEELNISSKLLQKKSKQLINEISHHYAGLTISTIDKFNYSLIKTFSTDLKLNSNFEVELDTNYFLDKTIDLLLQKTDVDKNLSKIITDYVLQKIDDDKSWNINDDLKEIGKLFLNENHIKYINLLNNISLSDFKELQNEIEKRMYFARNEIVIISKNILDELDEKNVDPNSFSYKNVPSFFKNCIESLDKINTDLKWIVNIETQDLYKKTTSPDQSKIIDFLKPKIIKGVNENVTHIKNIIFYKNLLKNLTPLSVINELKKCFEFQKTTDNKLLISEFNTLISKEIKDQPSPYIYERLGEKFDHFFIDEFQDTSEMQWENLSPLIGDSLSSYSDTSESSLLLVGDAKQAIYRWRGGKVEQFINLSNNINSFFIDADVQILKSNYRSFKTIVDFNNAFFNLISKTSLKLEAYHNLYNNSYQVPSNFQEGYVELNLIETSKEKDYDSFIVNKTINIIQDLKIRGYNYSDICIITRKKNEGVKLSEGLVEKNIPISSSETLLLKNATEILILIEIKKIFLNPKSTHCKLNLLELITCYKNFNSFHNLVTDLIHLENEDFFIQLSHFFNVNIDYNSCKNHSLTHLTQTLISVISGFSLSNAYIQKYLELTYTFQCNKENNLFNFLEYWELNENKLCLTVEDENTIKLMTIHKSKGLEFPIVIFPYANQKIYFQKKPKIWFPTNSLSSKIDYLYVDFNKSIKNHNDEGEQMFEHNQHQLELDAINLLYVTLTRAEKELYIIGDYQINSKTNEFKIDSYTGLFANFLKSQNLWTDGVNSYSLGTKTENIINNETTISTSVKNITENDFNFKLNKPLTPNTNWESKTNINLEIGVLLHNIMSLIYTVDDINTSLLHFKNDILNLNQEISFFKERVKKIVCHPELNIFFNNEFKILNEKAIIDSEGNTHIPDKIAIGPNHKVLIIDYKTGEEKIDHKDQLINYEKLLTIMGFKVELKVLVYVSNDIKIIKF